MWRDTLRRRLAEHGLDRMWPVPVRALPTEVPARVRQHGFARPNPLALLVGNTRALWPHFVAARAAPGWVDSPDPLDRYVDAALASALRDLPVRHHLHLAHVAAPDFVPLTAVARAAGLKVGACHLAIDPEAGPWIALRALVVVDAEAGPWVAMAPAACSCATGCGPTFERARAEAGWEPARWIAVRDACPLGRDHRYGPDQLAFHYRSP